MIEILGKTSVRIIYLRKNWMFTQTFDLSVELIFSKRI